MDTIIREATVADFPALAELGKLQLEYHLTWEPHWDVNWGFSEAASSRVETLVSDPNQLALVAASGDVVVGYLYGRVHEPAHPALKLRRLGTLSSMFVRREFRSQGIGRQLVEYFTRFCAERGVDRLTVEANIANDDTVAFYRNLGFRDHLVTLIREPGL